MRVPIHTIEVPLAPRAGETYQREALAPFPLRVEGDMWDLNRIPYHHRQPIGWMTRLGRLALGEQPPELQLTSRGAGLPLEIARAEAAREMITTGETTNPELLQQSFSLNVQDLESGSGFLVISTPKIPYPYEIVDAHVIGYTSVPGNTDGWNLYVTPAPYDGYTIDPPIGIPLIESYFSNRAQLFVYDAGRGPLVPFARIPGTSERDYDTTLVGRTVASTGQYLTFAAWLDSTPSTRFASALITIRAIAPHARRRAQRAATPMEEGIPFAEPPTPTAPAAAAAAPTPTPAAAALRRGLAPAAPAAAPTAATQYRGINVPTPTTKASAAGMTIESPTRRPTAPAAPMTPWYLMPSPQELSGGVPYTAATSNIQPQSVQIVYDWRWMAASAAARKQWPRSQTTWEAFLQSIGGMMI